MNPGRFFMPGYMGMRSVPFSNPAIGAISSVPRNTGLFSRIANGIRSFNWSGLLNNANKTLNVVNQAIPLVRQAGPMVSNMRNMLKIAKAFGSETTNKSNIRNTSNVKSNNNANIQKSSNTNDDLTTEKEVGDNNYPNFFI